MKKKGNKIKTNVECCVYVCVHVCSKYVFSKNEKDAHKKRQMEGNRKLLENSMYLNALYFGTRRQTVNKHSRKCTAQNRIANVE